MMLTTLQNMQWNNIFLKKSLVHMWIESKRVDSSSCKSDKKKDTNKTLNKELKDIMFTTLENMQQNHMFLILVLNTEVKGINIAKMLRINHE